MDRRSRGIARRDGRLGRAPAALRARMGWGEAGRAGLPPPPRYGLTVNVTSLEA
jgi:hypothetical protein